MTGSLTARRYLAMNSAFSALNGAILLVAASTLSPMIFDQPVDWAVPGLRLLGLGLIGFAALLLFLFKNKFVSKGAVNEIVFLDALWVVGSVVAIAFFGDVLTPTGTTVITAVAMAVAFFGIMQFVGASTILPPVPVAKVVLQDGKLIATVKRAVNAPTDTVWDVMTDHPAYADVASNIAKVEVVSGQGLGMKRRCFGPGGENWEETCDIYEPGQSYGFRINTEADNYPYPISELSGRWSVKPRDCGSEFEIRIVARPKGNAFARWMFASVARRQFKTILIDLADAWAERMEREAAR